MFRKTVSSVVGAVALLGAVRGAEAQDAGPVRLGVLTDMSSSLRDALGPGSVDSARMAIEDFGGKVLDRPVTLIAADHLNKADLGSTIARQWYDEGVQVILDLGSSAVAAAVQGLAREKNRMSIATGASSSDLSGKFCTPNSFQWSYDSYMFTHTAVPELLRQGKDTWFLIVPDYAFGHAMARDVTLEVEKAGGRVVGLVKHPSGSSDFTSYLMQAQSSNAKAIAVLSAGSDLQNTMKQGSEFQVFGKDQAVTVPAMMLVDVHAVGLRTMQGLLASSAIFYWDLNEKTRAFSERFTARNGKPPTEAQSMNYSAVTHYLKAVQAAGTTDTEKVIAKMREMPVVDALTEGARIREDGRLLRPVYLAEVKAPGESSKPWDYYKNLRQLAPEQVARPLSESECPLVKR